ncbi:response regulator [Paraburkholderia sp. J41]|uniref:response regulator n=1 Tax=Paraburkholderia sp. J41 TaxID=2805433 RepID=UPI002AC360B5|nr:response regulator [Paraburkholderia sp. J41]
MRRVLLVDDEPEVLEAWSFALAYAGYQVDCARNGAEALNLVTIHIPDLVVTDLMMPVMGGKDLCRALRDNPAWRHIPILLHTSARVGPTELWDAALRKPAHMETFLATAERLIRG